MTSAGNESEDFEVVFDFTDPGEEAVRRHDAAAAPVITDLRSEASTSTVSGTS